MYDEVLKRIITHRSGKLDLALPVDRIIDLCFRHNLYAVHDEERDRVLIGTLDRLTGSVNVNDDWERIEEEVFRCELVETWS